MYRRALNEGTRVVSVIVIEFITLDGIVWDPDGSGSTPSRRLTNTSAWAGPRLLPAAGTPLHLETLSAEQGGAGVRTRYGRAAR
jgi:hypothetical protein